MLTRQGYEAHFGTLPAQKADANGEVEWLALVREAHMAALKSTSSAWLDMLVAEGLPQSYRE